MGSRLLLQLDAGPRFKRSMAEGACQAFPISAVTLSGRSDFVFDIANDKPTASGRWLRMPSEEEEPLKKLSEQRRRFFSKKAREGSSPRRKPKPHAATHVDTESDKAARGLIAQGYEKISVYNSGRTFVGYAKAPARVMPEVMSFKENYEKVASTLFDMSQILRNVKEKTRAVRRIAKKYPFPVYNGYWDFSTKSYHNTCGSGNSFRIR